MFLGPILGRSECFPERLNPLDSARHVFEERVRWWWPPFLLSPRTLATIPDLHIHA